MLKGLFAAIAGLAVVLAVRAMTRSAGAGAYRYSDGLILATILMIIIIAVVLYYAFRDRLGAKLAAIGQAGQARMLLGAAGGVGFFGLVLLIQSDRYDDSRAVSLWLCGFASVLGAWGWIIRPK